MRLWIGNIAPGTTDDELKELVKKYAPQLDCAAVKRVDGDGSRPAALLEFVDPKFGAVAEVAQRLHQIYWKGRELFCETIVH